MKARVELAAAALLVFAVVLAGLFLVSRPDARSERPDSGPYRGSEPPAGIQLPEFELRSYRGDIVRAIELRRHVLVVTFLDTQCKEACPVIAAVVGDALRRLATPERRRVRAVAITTDPAEDSPVGARAFLRRHRAAGQLDYLLGSEATLRTVWRRFKVLSSLESGEDSLHSAPVRIYVHGMWVATQHAGVDLSAGNLAHDVRYALQVR